MHIGLVPEHFLPHVGGIERHVAGLARGLAARGHRVRVLTTTPGPAEVEGISVHRFRVPRVPVLGVPYTPRGILGLENHLKEEGYDLIHVHHSVVSPGAACAAYLAQRMGLPVVVTFHSIQDGYRGAFALLDGMASWTQWPVVFSVVSPAMTRGLQELMPHRTIRLLPNGVDRAFWAHAGREPREGIFRVVATLRLAPRKRPEALLPVARRVRDALSPQVAVSLRVFGDGPEGESLRKQARSAGLEGVVSFPGEADQETIRDAYGEADVFLLPTIEESFGLAALEARCAGLPVVARRSPGVAGFIEHGKHGLLAESDEELSECLVRLARDRGLLERMARENREAEPPESWDHVLDAHHRVYEEARALAMEGRHP